MNVALNKLRMNWREIDQALEKYSFSVRLSRPSIWHFIKAASYLRRDTGEHHNALIVAAALNANCKTLWSGDMHDVLIVEKRLEVRNPFTGPRR